MNVRNACAASGLVAPLVAAIGILSATLADPSFSWATSALSDMGALPRGRSVTASFLRSNPQFLLFNGGLILAGILGLPFARTLRTAAENRAHRAGAAAFAVAIVAMALVGVFHIPRPPHGAVAIAHYLAATIALWTYGTGTALAGAVRRGLATIWLGIAHVLFWILWALFLSSGPVPGIAVPETVGAAIFGAWILATARSRLGWPPLPAAVERFGRPS